MLHKDDDDWVKKCMKYEVEGLRPRGRPKRTWREVVREDCQARKLNKEDAVDHCKWRKMIVMDMYSCRPMGASVARLIILVSGARSRSWN